PDCIGGTSEGDEEGIPLGAENVPSVRLDRFAEQGVVLVEEVGIGVSKTLQQPGAAFDVREQERDGAGRQVRHGRPPRSRCDTTADPAAAPRTPCSPVRSAVAGPMPKWFRCYPTLTARIASPKAVPIRRPLFRAVRVMRARTWW